MALQDLGLYPRACNTLLATLELNIQDCQEFRKLTQEQLEEKLNKFIQEQPPSLVTVRGLRNLSDVLLGVEEQAINSAIALQASLNLADRLDPYPDKNEEIAAIYLRVGNIASTLNNTQAALEAYKQADTESAKVTTRIQSRLNQLSLLVKRQSWSEVPNLVSKIKSSLNDLPPSRTAVEARINLAQSLICFQESTMSDQQGLSSPLLQQCSIAGKGEKIREEQAPEFSEVPKWREIAEIVTVAVEQAKTLSNKRAEAYALGYLGGVYQQMGNFAAAQKLTEQALELASAFDAPEIAYRWQWQLGRLRQIQGDEPEAIAYYTLALQTLQSLRRDLVAMNPEVQFTFRESVEPVYREYVNLLLLPEQPSQDNLKRARDAIEALQLAELNDFFRDACVEAKPEQIDRVVDRATPLAAVFYTIFLPDRLAVILKLPQQEKLLHYTTLLPQNTREEVLTQLQEYLRDVGRSSQVKQLSQKVYQWLIQPAEAQLAASGIKTLVFVLDSSLGNIPMGVLYDGQQYLVEKYAIAVSPSLQLVSPQPLEKVELNALIGGLSEEIPLEGQKFPPLTNVPDELDEIKSALPSVELINANFNQKELEAQIKSGKFTVLHMATHGQFSSDPEDNFILLWDERLRPKDLARLLQTGDPYKPTPIELLVLSASETASGDNKAALGLASVAARAGVRSVLGTLWSVDDRSIALFMGQFYKELKNSDVTKAEALRNAQLVMLEKNERPYFWAPYILLGNWL